MVSPYVIQRTQEDAQEAELIRLRQELKRVTEERDILKKAAVESTDQCNMLCQDIRVKYRFIQQMPYVYSIRRMCQTLNVHVSGFYAWRQKPKSSRQCRDEHHQSLIKHSWLDSGAVYGYRKVWLDLLAMGESIGKNRVARLMRSHCVF